MKTNQTSILNAIEVKQLLELENWKYKQESLVKQNPFITIENYKTYEEAKKNRTALVRGRTEIEKQDKFIASKLRWFRTKVSETSKELIDITLPSETKQQEEVKRYEEAKAKEKAEIERKEQERKQKIKNEIDIIYRSWSREIALLTFDELDRFNLTTLLGINTSQFEEFELDFAEKVQTLTNLFNEKKEQLEIGEKQRVETENLKKEREKFEKEQRLAEEKSAKEEQDRRKAQALIDAKNREAEEKIAKEKAIIEKEKTRFAKIESCRLAKIEAKNRAKEMENAKLHERQQIEAIKKNTEELTTDKEKLLYLIDSVSMKLKKPEFQIKNSMEFYCTLKEEIEALREELHIFLSNLKWN